MTDKVVQKVIAAYGFAKAYEVDAFELKDAPDGVASLLLLIYPYGSWGEAKPGCPRISTYYFAAQEAYMKAVEIIKVFNEAGERAMLLNQIRLKPLLSRMKEFTQGRNTLNYHKKYGSRFHVQVIGLAKKTDAGQEGVFLSEERDMCASCRLCQESCPAKALTEDGFQRDRCLRQYMMSGKPVPEHMRSMMGNSLLGCDICQQVCPYNQHLPVVHTETDYFPLKLLLGFDVDAMKRLSQKIGKNIALPNRVCAQALIAAANSKQSEYLPFLHKLCGHPSPVVAQHAFWAVKQLTTEENKDSIP